ncbi:MAG: translation elongation factor Ts [Candidatus Moranbacteria bacterium]|nr:translation elongation factor Ts [Candidatus Moranbacteria bacterium]
MLDKVKKLREKAGAGVVAVKKALEEARGNEERAVEILRREGHSKAIKKSGRETREGVIAAYVHSNKKIGVLVQLLCETDFVARNSEFQELARDIAMQIAATDPQFLKPEEVTADIVKKERKIWTEQLAKEGKPEAIAEKILAGKEKKFREEISLLAQPFVKDPSITVGDLVAEKVGKIGENIQVGKFIRYDL